MTQCTNIEEAFEIVRSEMLKLRTLAFAVGRTQITELPESVVNAYRNPMEYRKDKLSWQEERIRELEASAKRVIRLKHEAPTTLGLSNAIEQLNAVVASAETNSKAPEGKWFCPQDEFA